MITVEVDPSIRPPNAGAAAAAGRFADRVGAPETTATGRPAASHVSLDDCTVARE
ncbi:MAG: hypothetical protein ABEJ73_12510 [Haloplanus sp.]